MLKISKKLPNILNLIINNKRFKIQVKLQKMVHKNFVNK